MADKYNDGYAEDEDIFDEETDMEEFFAAHKHELMYNELQEHISEQAVFFADLLEQGCEWHQTPGRLYLCRKKGSQWENALIYRMINFPKQEVADDVHASLTTLLWIEPDIWRPLNLEPNEEDSEETTRCFGYFAQMRFHPTWDEDNERVAEEWRKLVQRCKGKTYKQALEGGPCN